MPMRVTLCRMLMLRLGDDADVLEQRVADAGGEVDWEGCLNACTDCGKRIVANVGGHRMVADRAEELVEQVRAIAAG